MKFKDIEYEKPIFPHKEKRVHMVDRAAIITVNDGHHHQEDFSKQEWFACKKRRMREKNWFLSSAHVQYISCLEGYS